MSTMSWADSLEILERISKNGSMFLEEGDESLGFFVRKFVTNDNGRLSITMEEGVTKACGQRFQLVRMSRGILKL